MLSKKRDKGQCMARSKEELNNESIAFHTFYYGQACTSLTCTKEGTVFAIGTTDR